MMRIFEYAICLFFVCTMFPSFHIFCLNSIDNIVTHFFPRVKMIIKYYFSTITSLDIFCIIFSSFSKSLSPGPPMDSKIILLY